ncbi:alginate export family protein [Beggiatoa alba]|nr:alginate export family protein [bacterium AH-315-E07]MBN4081875.1 alginate export family protein [Beggiatoa alba]
MDARLRFENADQDNLPDNSNALTLRTRLGYETGKVSGFGGFFEFENVTAIGNEDNFLSPGPFGNGVTGRPVVADPSLTEINQAYISYAGISDTVAKYGRQRIVYDNARFIGDVIWRQNQQTYDGFAINNTSLGDTSLSYSFITNQNNVLGANVDVDVHSINASYSGFAAGKLTAYAYLSDFEAIDANDNDTYGLRFSGLSPIGNNKILYAAEYARQSDSNDNPASFDHDYLFFEGGLTFGPGITAKVAYELLGSDNGNTSFFTPFATLFKFQGWADIFLGTANATGFAGGVEDLAFTVTGNVGKVKLLAAYHDFNADESSFDGYGSEIDLSATAAIGKFNVGAQYASFSADTATVVDADKFWLWIETKI